ncbi:hypothetical protein P153DRAFT_315435 [Dothidotthia symphoricarpi CBS 119687]|uniref:Actin-like ATPase domain-containing protein n=1 Tax=Dothidotthia symphoricarpi CBS 119687 TaxID=1392245 RepID=A0A6A6AEH4_9PLEO|nr:uncharacterized protein P153DRAFT_315435 [Dothidotthia symphoricarpi CBS 119687]KAF2129966.1 hypothetical protein P153DRAFT_315435 [Dothidotthia symphoricarpi CBS 119687]
MESRACYPNTGRITMMKLMLDKSTYARQSKDKLKSSLKALKANGSIKEDSDVIRDFLVKLLLHTKARLEWIYELTERSTIELTFTIPVCWDSHAVVTMVGCIQEAMLLAKFGSDGTSASRLFMVTEQEAGAINVLQFGFHNFKKGEVFVLIDCGGGTTDLGTYRIAYAHPLRLESEVNDPTGAMCGSEDLNERFRACVYQFLRDAESYLVDEESGTTLDSIIDEDIMPQFEDKIKRSFDITDTRETFEFRISRLRESDKNPRLKRKRLVLSFEDMMEIFRPSLDCVKRLMEDQLLSARRKNMAVDKVVLVGGFGDSPALQTHLTLRLKELDRFHGTRVAIIFAPTNTGACGVAKGAVLRAKNKAHGPRRVPRQSIGIYQHIPCTDVDSYPKAVFDQKRELCKLEGDYYIMNTIVWKIKKGQGKIASTHTVTYESVFMCNPKKRRWIATQDLFASSECTEDYYKRGHVKNKGRTTELGKVDFDITHLRNQIKAKVPTKGDGSLRHYSVTLLIEMTVIDRDLKFVARWPPNENGTVIQGDQQYFSLVSAFQPGTA